MGYNGEWAMGSGQWAVGRGWWLKKCVEWIMGEVPGEVMLLYYRR